MDRLSKFFTKTTRENPQGEEAVNAKLLIRGGYIAKQMAGVYTLLSLGLKVVEKINRIIRQELNAIGAKELLMPALQPKELWDKTGRWQSAKEVMYQFKDNSGKEVGLGWTHEEVITHVAKQFIHSYRDLPKAIYQIQTKFRDEPRAKSGILRGREFLMKDLYSFHLNSKDRDEYYEKVSDAYEKIFKRLGLDVQITESSGGAFSKYSHEFQVIAESGEDTIYVCKKCGYACNGEIVDEIRNSKHEIRNKSQIPNPKFENYYCPECSNGLEKHNAIEVGNIFKLGTRFSEAFGLLATDKNGQPRPVEMASYGIGPTRVMGTIVEVSHDEKGIIWTKETAPYDAHIIEVKSQKSKVKSSNSKLKIDELTNGLEKAGLEVLFDDREDVSPGEKLAEADLIGIPWRIVVSPNSITKGGVEVKRRDQEKAEPMAVDKMLDRILRKY